MTQAPGLNAGGIDITTQMLLEMRDAGVLRFKWRNLMNGADVEFRAQPPQPDLNATTELLEKIRTLELVADTREKEIIQLKEQLAGHERPEPTPETADPAKDPDYEDMFLSSGIRPSKPPETEA